MKFKLIYNHKTLGKPVLAEAVLNTGILINILEAKITPTAGEIIIDVPVTGEKLEEIILFFKNSGVVVKEITQVLEIDMDKCISCGACVSSCPTQAIKQNPDWSIEFDEKKCVRCQICVHACPVGAVRLI